MKKYFQNLFLILVSVILSVLFAQGALKIFYPLYKNYNTEMWRYAKEIKTVSDDTRISHEHRPNVEGTYYGSHIKTNSNGWRESETPLRSDKYRIMVLGDSITLGWGVENQDSFPRKLEARLSREKQNYEVINTGVGNYNTQNQVYAFLKKGKQYQPNEIIVAYYINDAEIVQPPQSFLKYQLLSSYIGAFLGDKWITLKVSLFDQFHYDSFYSSLYEPNFKGRKAVEESLTLLANYCRENQIRLSVAVIPEMHQFQNYPFPQVFEFVSSIGQAQRFTVKDLLPYFTREEPSTLWVSNEDAHPNAKGHQIIADALYELILKDSNSQERKLAVNKKK